MDEIRVSSKLNDRENEIKKRLRSYLSLVSEYNARKELYDTLFPKQTSTIRDVPIAGKNEETELERIVYQRISLSKQMDRSLALMRDEIVDILSIMKGLPALETAVLVRRYTLGQTFEEISKEMHYCRGQVYRINCRAITRIAERCYTMLQGNVIY